MNGAALSRISGKGGNLEFSENSIPFDSLFEFPEFPV